LNDCPDRVKLLGGTNNQRPRLSVGRYSVGNRHPARAPTAAGLQESV
jgi:hypothetical protein